MYCFLKRIEVNRKLIFSLSYLYNFVFSLSVLDNNTDNHSPILSNLSRVVSEDDEQQPPALMIYIVEPFTFGQSDSSLYRLVTLGLLHSYADMLSSLPEATKNSISLQVCTCLFIFI